MNKIAGRLYNFLIVAGGLLTLIQLVLSMMNSSLCSGEGCRIVESYLQFDERYMFVGGFLFFCALYVAERRESLRKYGSLLLMCALAAEGYLVGFQYFIIHSFCLFCLSIASIVVCLALAKIMGGIREPMLAGFCLFVVTASLVGSVNTVSTPIPSDRYVLIYSKDCPHCEELIRWSKEKAIPLKLCEANQVKGALKWMGLNAVPVLICTDDKGKAIYSGENVIKEILTAKNDDLAIKQMSASSSAKIINPAMSKSARNAVAQRNGDGSILGQANQSGLYSSINQGPKANETGACPIDQKAADCK